MNKFDFLIGDWNLKYSVPKSSLSAESSGSGEGTFYRALNNKYVFFDYKAQLTTGSAQAHGIFAKDGSRDNYKYWWFDDSGAFSIASCKFIKDNLLFMIWHDSCLIQTFELINQNYIVLIMSQAIDNQNFEPVLKVEFSRK
ncbi:MAG: hypothetical protein AB7T22_10260 [Calditrichaceae bacterium]